MAVEDIKGYKPHTDEKIGTVNAIKDAEVRLGLIFSAIEDNLTSVYTGGDDMSESELDQALAAVTAIHNAKQKLKEASMWACRSVFQPEEKY